MTSPPPPSPLFDAPEFPSLRRVKPLPKRRRTSSSDSVSMSMSAPPHADPLPFDADPALSLHDHDQSHDAYQYQPQYSYIPLHQHLRHHQPPLPPSPPPSDSDYLDPQLGTGTTKKRKVPAAALPPSPSSLSSPASPVLADDAPAGHQHQHPIDHLPTETGDQAYRQSRDQATSGTRRTHPHTQPQAHPDVPRPPASAPRMHPSTRVGLARKAFLRARRHRLAAALGTLRNGDDSADALDAALASPLPLLLPFLTGKSVGVRGRRRPRVAKRSVKSGIAVTSGTLFVPATKAEFTFTCPSATADRLIAMREEAVALRARIEAELARQAAAIAAKVDDPPAATAVAVPVPATGKGVRTKARKTRTVAASASAPSAAATVTAQEPAAPPPPPPLPQVATTTTAMPAGKSKRGKKKKRSALANASNPHHLRNYVPSRLPGDDVSGHSGSGSGGGGWSLSELLSPIPLRFLTAGNGLSGSGGGGGNGGSGGNGGGGAPLLVSPAEEWICPTCEYRLFYGDEGAYRRAIGNRKKILKRRRRARERAAAAASGRKSAVSAPAPVAPPAADVKDEEDDDEYGDGEEDGGEEDGMEDVLDDGGGGQVAVAVAAGSGSGRGRRRGRVKTGK